MSNHDPEVSLAVRVEGTTVSNPDADEDLDAFLSDLGFEFVDTSRGKPADHDIDALSTGISTLYQAISPAKYIFS